MLMLPCGPDAISIGYLLPTRDAITLRRPEAAPLIALGVHAEALGLDAVWVGDGPLARPRHDGLLMLAALAACTERVALGTAVLLAALRPALLLAQAASTLDQIAAGRLILGVGAGFPFPETERQFAAVGVPYAGRLGRMTETIAAIRELWARPGESCYFAGRHIALNGVALEPGPRRAGGPPVWLAGAGERAERRVGEIADGWLPYLPSAEEYGSALERVRAAAHAAARRPPHPGLYATVAIDASARVAEDRLRQFIERYYSQPLELIASIQATYAGTPEGAAEWVGSYLDSGARHVVLRPADENSERGLEAAADLRERLAAARRNSQVVHLDSRDRCPRRARSAGRAIAPGRCYFRGSSGRPAAVS
jgi:alkanesulfonate monooxygenase SsuD/methylene tetrahydromethanopterin reductase-like flavin-dependent oxidoreductase (luciferase family)